MIDETIEYTRQRKAFGQSILDNQVVHFKLAELQTEVELLRSLIYRAAEAMIAGEDVTKLREELAARFGEQHPLPHLHRDLALAGLHHVARDAQPVAEVQVAELLEAGSRVGGGEQLHPAARVGERGERQLSLHAPQQDAAGDAHRDRALLTRLEVCEVLLDRGRVPRSLEAKWGLLGHRIT